MSVLFSCSEPTGPRAGAHESNPPKLLDRLRHEIRRRHMSPRSTKQGTRHGLRTTLARAC